MPTSADRDSGATARPDRADRGVAPLVIPVVFGPMQIGLFGRTRTADVASRIFLGVFVFGFVVLPGFTCVNVLVRCNRRFAPMARRAANLSPGAERLVSALAGLARSGGVTIKSSQGLTTFGEGLEDEEVRYLHAIVRRALQGR